MAQENLNACSCLILCRQLGYQRMHKDYGLDLVWETEKSGVCGRMWTLNEHVKEHLSTADRQEKLHLLS